MQRHLRISPSLALLLLCFGYSASSQVPIRLGVVAGINYAKDYLSNEQSNFGTRIGFISGGLIEVEVSDNLYIQVEPRYTQSGRIEGYFFVGGVAEPTIVGTGDRVFKLDYLQIPLLLKTNLSKTRLRPFVFAGPNIGYLISGKAEWEGYDVRQVGMDPSLDVKNEYESLDISFDLGAGLEYQISADMAVLADVRYSAGLNKINNDNSGISIRSGGIQVLAGILYGI